MEKKIRKLIPTYHLTSFNSVGGLVATGWFRSSTEVTDAVLVLFGSFVVLDGVGVTVTLKLSFLDITVLERDDAILLLLELTVFSLSAPSSCQYRMK